MCIYKHVPHTRLENIKNEGFLLRRFYDRKRASFCHLYARRQKHFEILKERKQEREKKNENIMLKNFMQETKKCKI